MKTHRFIKYLCALTLFMGLATAFTSCDDWDDDDWDTFNDTRFEGDWVLTSNNGEAVTNLDTEYLELDGYGEGTLYYLSDGVVMTEPVSYNCQESVSGNTRYQINIQYGSDIPNTVNYYFPNLNTFVLRWVSSYGPQEQVWERVDGIPW